jgi:hypothetical protein
MLANGGDNRMLRIFLAASLALPLVVQGPGQQPARTTGQSSKPLTLAQVWMLNATYTDPQHGVTFRHPGVWQATAQSGYHASALSQSEEARPIAGFAYSEGGFPRSAAVGPYTATNLESVGIVYSAVPAATVDACQTLAASVAETPQHTQVLFGSRSFAAYPTGSAGMSHSISGTLYAAHAGPTCYLFETDMAVVAPGVVDGIQALTSAQLDSIHNHLLEVMKTVQIVPGG